MVRDMTIVAMVTPTMTADAFTVTRSRCMGISASRRSAISGSARSLRSSRVAVRHRCVRIGPLGCTPGARPATIQSLPLLLNG